MVRNVGECLPPLRDVGPICLDLEVDVGVDVDVANGEGGGSRVGVGARRSGGGRNGGGGHHVKGGGSVAEEILAGAKMRGGRCARAEGRLLVERSIGIGVEVWGEGGCGHRHHRRSGGG
jgi:hypothetical protein